MVFFSGEYTGQLAPGNSGTESDPIVFRSADSRTARLIHRASEENTPQPTPRLLLDGVSHVRIEGFHVEFTGRGAWLNATDCSHITIADCRFAGGPGSPSIPASDGSFRIARSEQVRIVDNDFARKTFGGDLLHVSDSRRLLFEGNSFSRSLHTLMVIHLPFRSSEQIVIRGNVFHAGWSRNLSNTGHDDILVENNIFVNAYNGGRSAGSMNQFAGNRNILRFNRVFRNYGVPWVMAATADRPSENVRVYNNLFHGNRGAGLVLESRRPPFRGMVIKNSIFAGNDPYGSRTQLALSGGGAESVRVINNAFDAEYGDASSIVLYGDYALGLDESRDDAAEFRGVFLDNVEGPAGLADPERFDFSLEEQSSLRDAGAPLTETRAAGRGRSLPVEDPYYFYDGYGIEGEKGDLIVVGRPENRAYVVAIDYDNRVLELDRALEWESGSPVAFPWTGDGPDIGVFEHGDTVRPQVQILASTAFPEPGEKVELHAVVRGMEPPFACEWQFGDDARALGKRVHHFFDPGQDYGIRVRVTDANGRRAIGVGYINAELPLSDDVMLHTTFDEDDEDWWVHWQFYRGRRGTGYARHTHVLDKKTGKGYHHVAPLDGTGPLPAFLHPRDWEIEKYPRVRLRYRISPGTPLAVFVSPYPSAEYVTDDWDFRQDTRRYYLAGTRAEPRGNHVLVDDGEWQEITLDVREIGEEFPGTDRIHSLHIGDLEVDGGAPVGPEHEFWLDEIYIGK